MSAGLQIDTVERMNAFLKWASIVSFIWSDDGQSAVIETRQRVRKVASYGVIRGCNPKHFSKAMNR